MDALADIKKWASEYAQRYGNLKLEWSDYWDIELDYEETWPNNSKPGCYFIFNDGMELLYIGKASHIGARLSSYFRFDETRTKGVAKNIESWSSPPRFIVTVGLEHSYEAPSLEEYLLIHLKTSDNKLWQSSKTGENVL
ncbi:GIY-YIG nuclease family protein [Hwanghaeella sp. LZ110]|uniref:GIY-YIG nuclease family protein n=1 Tax=Hwanghaeella sp. LZ110 TaxID=3402810 RepID=UPI003B675F3F